MSLLRLLNQKMIQIETKLGFNLRICIKNASKVKINLIVKPIN